MNRLTLCIAAGLIYAALPAAHSSETNADTDIMITANVPGTANPWLAQCPDGTVAGAGYDVAPNESPVELTGVSSNQMTVFTFSVTGGVSHDPGKPLSGGDGNVSFIWSRTPGPEHGIGDITAPADALIAVFVDENVSTNSPVPAPLDFASAEARDFLTLSPRLRQPFFIGDGRTTDGRSQQFIPPAGTTRLILGCMDSYGWFNNTGSFTVRISVIPSATER